jgi:hypothetical protein
MILIKGRAKKIRFSDDTSKPSAPIHATSKPQYPIPTPIPSYTAPVIKPTAPPPPQPNYHPMSKLNMSQYSNMMQQQQQQQRMPPIQTQKYSAPPPAVVVAAPTRSAPAAAAASSYSDDRGPSATTIEAKPMLRNKMAEITRFVPTSLVVRRDIKSKAPQRSGMLPITSLFSSKITFFFFCHRPFVSIHSTNALALGWFIVRSTNNSKSFN